MYKQNDKVRDYLARVSKVNWIWMPEHPSENEKLFPLHR